MRRARAYRLYSKELLPCLLVRTYRLRLGQHVSGEGALELLAGGLAQVVQHRVECVEDEEVSMPADGRTGTTVARLLPVVQALQRSLWQRRLGDSLRQSIGAGRQVVEHPMDVVHARGGRIGGIGIVHHQGQALRALGNAGELERGGYVVPLAGMEAGDLAALRERGRTDGQHARTLLRA